MLEGLAAWILNTYIGEYLENLNTDQLSIALLQGEVELENLPLKKDALNGLGLPIEIRAGFVGKVKIQIPVRRLRSEPWVIFVEKLYLVAGPVSSSQYNEEEELQNALHRKLSRLEALETKWKAAHETKQEASYYSYGNWLGYGTSLVANIVENLQLKIKDVHIRFEDQQICPNSCFACGIIIRSLSAQSTDRNWVPKFVSRDSSDTMWKLVQLDDLSVYWDTSATMYGQMDMQQISVEMAKNLSNGCIGNIQEQPYYILAPVNAKAHLQRNCSSKPLRSRSTPRIVCDIHLEKIPLSLSEAQYKQIMEWEREFESLDAKWKYRRWRPSIPVKDNPKEWWHYAISVYLEPLRQRNRARTWSFVIERVHDIIEYSKVYHSYLSNPEICDLNNKVIKDELEKKLNFDELCILREMVMERIQQENFSRKNSGGQSKGQGFLQWMFPSWTGWYSSPQSSTCQEIVVDNAIDTEDISAMELKNNLEEEILGVLDNADNDTLLKRDAVFAQMNFSLSQGSFTLLSRQISQDESKNGAFKQELWKPIIELEFSDVSTKLETRPRTGSLLGEIKLGALYLHDRVFTDTSFPHIVAPQSRDTNFMYTKTSGCPVIPFPAFLSQKCETDSSGPLFELLYEKKPHSVQADHRLVVMTRSIDVVYNPEIIRHITDFFSLHHGKVTSDFSVSELKLTAAARARYEVLKEQTKAELKQKLDRILEGKEKPIKSSQWSIELAISAPQIIMPEDIFEKNSTVVVFDLGKLHFFNASKEKISKSISPSDDIDEDEDFQTPCSTPQELTEQLEALRKLDNMDANLSDHSGTELLMQHMYERYTLELSDMQVLVSRLKDNWKFAQLRGTSTMHILDRFSISVQMERRIMFIQDPQWPGVTLSGNLPKLIVHVSEQKVNALRTCIDMINSPIANYQTVPSEANHRFGESSYYSNNSTYRSGTNIDGPIYESNNQKAVDEETLLILMQFCVDQMSFNVQSRGRSIAELQVTGVKTTFSKRPYDTSITLCVHSLLLVDALQTYGPDFELLVASHKHVSMDSTSGSLRDSEPNSPLSPRSPDVIQSSCTVAGPTPPSALSAALSSLQCSNLKANPKKWMNSYYIPCSERSDSDALIIVEFNIIESPSNSQEKSEILQIASVQFNNLDIIANQETIVELVGLVNRISLRSNHQSQLRRKLSADHLNSKLDNPSVITDKKHASRTEVTFDFHRLNVLLLRAVNHNFSTVGQKVATATMSGARVHATLGTSIEIEGSLDGLQVLDLITENTKHSKIISMGYDPLSERPADILIQLQEDLYKSVNTVTLSEPTKALTFSVSRCDITDANIPSANSTCGSLMQTHQSKGELDITVRMASVCYTHSPRLLYELSSCATEFKNYMAVLASSIKSAATEVAIGIVTKRTESISATFHNTAETSPMRKRHESSDDSVNDKDFLHQVLSENEVSLVFQIDIVLQTPVVVIPSSPTSSHVLVAHLGRIAIQNISSGSLMSEQFTLSSCDPLQEGTVFVEIRDMNLYFLNIDQNIVQSSISESSGHITYPSLNHSVREIYFCDHHGQAILHDTILEILIQPVSKPNDEIVIAHNIDYKGYFSEEDIKPEYFQKKQIKVIGRVVTPLKVVLTKLQYQQVLKTLDYLTFKDAITLDTSAMESLTSKDSVRLSETHLSSEGTLPNSSSIRNTAQHTSIEAIFELPDFFVELRGDPSEREEGIVSLTFQDFVMKYQNEQLYETSLQVTLHALLMEDLRETEESHHCSLMMSSNHNVYDQHHAAPVLPQFISSSCPDLHVMLPNYHSSASFSLPDHLHTTSIFNFQNTNKGNGAFKSTGKTTAKTKATDSYPSTPPPSPSSKVLKKINFSQSQDALVSINILLVDRKSPLFVTKHRKTDRFVDIDFNCLDITVNLQTWVMVLDFFGVGSSVSEINMMSDYKKQKFSKENSMDSNDGSTTENCNSEWELTVRSLTVILNKPEYKLASANISNFYSHMSFVDNNLSILGKLGSISLTDLTPHGLMYPERFVTTGTEALHFDIFKYGKQDASQVVEYDLHVKCQMSSVRYVHTHRFLSETTAFFHRFTQMQDILARIHAAASGAMVNESTRGSKIQLNISAGSPVIVIPQHSSSAEVLVANLGHLTVHNTFLSADSPGTISHKYSMHSCTRNTSNMAFSKKVYGSLNENSQNSCLEMVKNLRHSKETFSELQTCLLDVINVELTDMDLYSALRIAPSDAKSQKSGKREEIFWEDSDLLFPSFLIRKQGSQLLQQKFMLQVQVERNLDIALSHAVPDMTIEGMFSSVHVTLNLEQYKLIYGILNHNLGEPLEEFMIDPGEEKQLFVLVDEKESSWTSMAIHMDLVNVTLELVRNSGIANKPKEAPLAKFDFIKSRLSYESYSDNSKDIDLVSNEIRVSDTRYKDAPVNNRPNVFTNVLQPTKRGESKNSVLQAEIHYRITQEFTRFTVLLNNMRVMGIFDWFQNVLEFLMSQNSIEVSNKASSVLTIDAQKSSVNSKFPRVIQPFFEMKINVTDTELVVVEDTSLWDSSAVILKSTAVIAWKPKFPEKPLSCSLQSLEVFSCILGVEEETALSILDPVTVNIDIMGKQTSPIAKLQSNDTVHTLEVSLLNLNVRLSYYDITMFLKIIESFKRQTGLQFQKKTSKPLRDPHSALGAEVKCLEGLGFSPVDCRTALDACSGNLNDAALWLTQNASPKDDFMFEYESDVQIEQFKVTSDVSEINLHSAEVRMTSCCLCIIDDCKDADVPVVEITLADVIILQKLLGSSESHGTFVFSGDYYNRLLSGWEPIIEPWRCNMKWNFLRISAKPYRKVVCQILAEEIINFNITSTFLDMYKTVKENWMEDYVKSSTRSREPSSSDTLSPGCYRRRSPFVPFALKNDTGCRLWFTTQVTSADRLNSRISHESSNMNKKAFSWTEVSPGQICPVSFESRAKIRHKDSHEMKIHQIIARVDGWQQVAPVSVDRVGIYFRQAKPQISRSSVLYTHSSPARVVFVVALEGSARKLITVQSALLITNKLEDTIEVKMENTGMQLGALSQSLYIIPRYTIPIPLTFVHAQIWVRPMDKSVTFSTHPIAWHHVTKPGEVCGSIRVCNPMNRRCSPYRFSVSVKRMKYPEDKCAHDAVGSSHPISIQPGHKIIFLPSLEITNLLPYELHYCAKDLKILGYVKSGKAKPLYDVDISEPFGVEFSLENFKRCNEISVLSSSRHYPSRLELYDNQDRILALQLRILSIPGGALKLFVSSPYWLVNKTGLPLVFKQEGTHLEAAGQFEEHEIARSMAPLLFSFADRDASAMCSMRLGKSLHSCDFPQWCTRFHLEKGARVRRLHVIRKDSRPDRVYIIGIDVRMGRGRYRDTHIVTLSPRYQLDNRSSHKLEFCQLFATREEREYALSAMPKCSLPFHWPRIDLDNLLCVRLTDIPECHWSGGFAIDSILSFHINMRDGLGKSHFLRVEIVLQGATFFIMFTDAERLPSPIRIDNHSEVAVTYYQTNVTEERLKTSVRPHSSVFYAWDEPTLPPFITCCAPGGSIATYNMDVFREGSQLFYENFIYIAFTGTFLRELPGKRQDFSPQDITGQEFVLDVPIGTKVILNRKEAGKRSQLWRMTSTGMLQHEGSGPPRDPHKSSSISVVSRGLVLDIAGLGPQPGEFTPLMLRKPDERRKHTQAWKFTVDGRLRCGYPNMYVQAKDGFTGLKTGNEVVLGPTLPVSMICMENGIPIEQAISRQKLRGGSGVLSVKVIPDGPTRVLQITDLKQKILVSKSSSASEWIVVEEENASSCSNAVTLYNKSVQKGSNRETDSNQQNVDEIEFQVCLKLTSGVGLSFVNHLSEELLYVTLHGIMVEYTKAFSAHSLDGSIKDIQMDNQLREAERPVLLIVTPFNKTDSERHLPAVHFTVHREITPLINAEIFKHFIVTIKNLTIQLEECLLLKLLQFAGFNQSNAELEKMDENDNQMQRSVVETSTYEQRYYFSTLKLLLHQLRLSVLTTSNLPPDLRIIKKKVGLRLVRFEDAVIELDPFLRVHLFETADRLVDNIFEHYKEELKSQATKILGAVDFLGNPLGLMNDVADGFAGLIHEGNVGGLIKNVTHGLSDSAAKLSEALSDGLGFVAMDDKHQKMRKRIRQESVAAGNDHLMAGLKGLGIGLMGGVTSLFTQTYEGAAQEGIQGFLSGLGKGLVGTVAKPAVGFLDFASGAASAVRDTSKKNPHMVLVQRRPPRASVGACGLLPRYSFQQALGQEFLYNLNERNYSEMFLAKEQIRAGAEDLHALISSKQVYFLSGGSPSSANIVLMVPLGDLFHCSYVHSEAGVVGETRHYLQLVMRADSNTEVFTAVDPLRHSMATPNERLCKKPQVRCDSENIAKKVTQQINYAKSLHEETTYMVESDEDEDRNLEL